MIESGFKSDRGMFVWVSRVLVFLVAVFVCTSIVICPAHAEDSSTPSRFNEAGESSDQDLGTQGAQLTNGQPGRELAGERSSSRDVTLSNAATPVGTDSSASKNESSAKPEADDSKADLPLSKSPSRSRSKPDGCKIPMALGIISQIRRPSPRQVGLPLVAPGIGCNRTQTARWPRPSGLPTRTRNTT